MADTHRNLLKTGTKNLFVLPNFLSDIVLFGWIPRSNGDDKNTTNGV